MTAADSYRLSCGWRYEQPIAIGFGYGASDVYVIKVDSNGSKIWSNVYGGTNVDWGYAVEQTPDSNFVIAGYTTATKRYLCV